MRGRLRGIRERGGKVVVVDPRRTRTADEADEHHFIRPGSDALLLAAMACTLVRGVARGRRGRSRSTCEGLDEVCELVRDYTPEEVAPATGIAAEDIRRMARELAAAERAAVYARIGTTTQEFGTHASWLVDVLNVLTGNLDREGGAMFTLAAAGPAQLERRARRGPRRAPGPLAEPRARARRGVRRAAGGLPGGGDRHARRGPGPGADHDGRATRWSPRRTAAGSSGGRGPRLHARAWTST